MLLLPYPRCRRRISAAREYVIRGAAAKLACPGTGGREGCGSSIVETAHQRLGVGFISFIEVTFQIGIAAAAMGADALSPRGSRVLPNTAIRPNGAERDNGGTA